jgi:hypothetical protein
VIILLSPQPDIKVFTLSSIVCLKSKKAAIIPNKTAIGEGKA